MLIVIIVVVNVLNTGSDKAEDKCYELGNVEGDLFGNCGQNSTDFLPCSPK